MEYTIVPSLPPFSFTDLVHLASALRGHVPELQIDIVDGQFVPPMSWPFTEGNPKEEFSKLALLRKDFELEIDCMVTKPERYLDIFVGLGIKRVVIHVGSTEIYESIFDHADQHGYSIGLALTNDLSLDELYPYMYRLAFVQLMGIANIGQQGQPFDDRTLTRVTELRSKHPDLEIAIDGSVNKDTIPILKKAGANRFLPGSAISKAEDPLSAYQDLVALV